MKICNYCNREIERKDLMKCYHMGIWGYCKKPYHVKCATEFNFCHLHGFKCTHCDTRVGDEMLNLLPTYCDQCERNSCGRAICFKQTKYHKVYTMSKYCSSVCMEVNIALIAKYITQDLASIVVKQYLSGTLLENDKWIYHTD